MMTDAIESETRCDGQQDRPEWWMRSGRFLGTRREGGGHETHRTIRIGDLHHRTILETEEE